MMPVVLGTKLKMDGKVVEEGTPVGKLSKAQRDLAKELNLLVEVPNEDEPEDEPEDEKAPAEDSKES